MFFKIIFPTNVLLYKAHYTRVCGSMHHILDLCFRANCSSQAQTEMNAAFKMNAFRVDMKKYPPSCIRNFGIIAHVDHGKSTLSDRLMEFAGNISAEERNEQVLDTLQVERERGITVKAQTVSLFYTYKGQRHLLNLIDTPGHVDFSHEVSRSLAACEGVILLVDANQGIQAQTVANFNLAFGRELMIIPVLNKIDLKNASPDAVALQMNSLFGTDVKEILKVSAKLGTGIKELFDAIIERIPPPQGSVEKPFRALLYDSWYSSQRGAVCIFIIVDGLLKPGDIITSKSAGKGFEVKQVGILLPSETPVSHLQAGQAGYVLANIRDSKKAVVGETWFIEGSSVEELEGIMPSKPMVFAGIFPSDQSQLQSLKKAIDKLLLNDSSVQITNETSPGVGIGWRLGFLGLLHMEVFCQRLDQEFDAQVVVTAPSVPYKVKIKGAKNIKLHGGDEIIITNPVEFPDPANIVECFEPMVLGTIIVPDEYYSKILKLCLGRRGIQQSCLNIDDHTVMMVYKFPMSEIIVDFFDALKSLSSGFASFDYEEIGYEHSDLVKLEFLLNGKLIEELTLIVHASKVESVGRSVCLRLKENIEPHLFLIAIQASTRGKIVARENIKALKKNVTAKLYGGDVTRRMKLLGYQSAGKRQMRMIGKIQVPRDAFIKVLKR